MTQHTITMEIEVDTNSINKAARVAESLEAELAGRELVTSVTAVQIEHDDPERDDE